MLRVGDQLVFHQPDMCEKFGPRVTIDRVQGRWAWSGLWGFNEATLVENWLPNNYVHIEHAPSQPSMAAVSRSDLEARPGRWRAGGSR